jgi:hypothetical protein
MPRVVRHFGAFVFSVCQPPQFRPLVEKKIPSPRQRGPPDARGEALVETLPALSPNNFLERIEQPLGRLDCRPLVHLVSDFDRIQWKKRNCADQACQRSCDAVLPGVEFSLHYLDGEPRSNLRKAGGGATRSVRCSLWTTGADVPVNDCTNLIQAESRHVFY